MIRNNFIYNNGDGPNTDVGLGLESACSVKVDNNTVVVPYWAPIEYRFSGSSNLMFRNNLVNGGITLRDGAPAAVRSNNQESIQSGWFVHLTNGNLHIKPGVTSVIDRGCLVADFSDDLDGDLRPVGAAWDIGADEYNPWNADSNEDGVPDGWYQQYGLNATSHVVAVEDGDGDGYANQHEWVALTVPTNGQSFFQAAGFSLDPSLAVRFACSTARVYSLQYKEDVLSNSWQGVPGLTNQPGLPGGWMTLAPVASGSQGFYRITVQAP